MNLNILGEEMLDEYSFKITYEGESFNMGGLPISLLYKELQAAESLVKDSIQILIDSGKLDSSYKGVEIYIEIEKGSLKETLTIVFKKALPAVAVAGPLIYSLINTTYSHFLDMADPTQDNPFEKELQVIENNAKYKENLTHLLGPLQDSKDTVIINNGTMNLTINSDDKARLSERISEPQRDDSEFKKNGDFHQTIRGVIRKLDLDAANNSYFGFNIDGGPSRIPTSISGEFHLNDYKNVIDEHVEIQATVKYKDDEIKHIEIESYKLLDSQDELSL